MSSIKESSLERQWKLLRQLSKRPGGVPVAVLQRISGDQLDKDIEALQGRGYPVFRHYDSGSAVFAFAENFPLVQSLKFTHTDMLALWFYLDVLELFKGTDLFDDIYLVREKVAKAVPESYLQMIKEMQGAPRLGVFPSIDYRNFQQTLEVVAKAVDQKLPLEFIYESSMDRRQKPRVSYPAKVVYMDHALYVIGWDPQASRWRWFLVHRMAQAKLGQGQVVLPETMDWESLVRTHRANLESADHLIHLKIFGSAVAHLGETMVHPSQKVLHQPDLTADCYLKMPVTPELVAWVLSLGSQCVVVSPPTLKDRIGEEIQVLHRRYSDNPLRKQSSSE